MCRDAIASVQLCTCSAWLVHVGLKPNFTVWVPSITFQKLQEMELVAEDEANLAQKLFDAIFKEDSENRPNDVCCTEADGKELFNSI